MATFPEFVGGSLGALKPSKVGPFKVGTLGTRYAAVLNDTFTSGTVVTTDTSITTQVYFGTLGGAGIIWDDAGSNPGTSTDPGYPSDGYVSQYVWVSLDGGTSGTDTQTFTYAGPNQVGTVFSTAFLLATESVITTFVHTNTTFYEIYQLSMYKSTDTGQTWTDIADGPLLSYYYPQYSVCFDQNNGTAIHTVYVDASNDLTYVKFDCNADTWGTPDPGPAPEQPATGTTIPTTMEIGCIHQPSGNNVAVMVAASTAHLDAIQYAIGGGWGAYSAMGVGSGGDIPLYPSAIICGSSDIVTCMQISLPPGTGTETLIKLWQQAISSGGSPGTQEEVTIGESPGGEVANPYPVDLCWNPTDNQVTCVFYLQGHDNQTIYYLSGTSADPVSFTTQSFAGATGTENVGDVACAVNGAGTYVFWPVPDGDFVFENFYYNNNLGPRQLVGTTTDFPETSFSLDAAGFSGSVAICWNDQAYQAQFYWEIFPPSFTGHRMMPQYIKRFNAPGN